MVRTNGNNIALRSIGKPAASFPGAVATDQHLAIAVDRQQTQLALLMTPTDTAMTVVNPGIIVPWSLLSIENEIVQVTGTPTGNIVPVSRGFDGTAAATHLLGATVSGLIDAYHHNTLVAEVEAIETFIGPNGQNIGTSSYFVVSKPYDFPAQSPGGSLAPGNNVITLSPVPKGVNGSDQAHYLYIPGGTGTPEAVLITGGSAVSGAASGTLIVNCANAHSGAWTIKSATAGIQEAVNASNNAIVYVPSGIQDIYATITFPQNHSGMMGDSGGSVAYGYGTYLKLHFTTGNAIYCNIPTALRLEHLSMQYATPAVSGTAIYLDDTGGALIQTALINDISIDGAWQGIVIVGNICWLTNAQIRVFYRGVILGDAAGHVGGPFFSNVIITSIAASAGAAPAGGMGLLVRGTTGGFISGLIIGGPFDYGEYFDTVGPVHEVQQTNFLIDGFKIGGLWVAPGSDFSLWNFANFEVNASLTLGTEQSVMISDAVIVSLSNFNIGAGQYGLILQAANQSITVTAGQFYGSHSVAALVWIVGNFRDLTIAGCGIGGSYATAANGLVIDASTSTTGGLAVTGNVIFDGVATPMTVTGSCPHMLIAGNAGIDSTIPAAIASAATITAPVNPVVPVSGTATVTTINGGWKGRRIHIIKTDAGTVTIGGGGNIPGSHSLAQYGGLDLVFDGLNWY